MDGSIFGGCREGFVTKKSFKAENSKAEQSKAEHVLAANVKEEKAEEGISPGRNKKA